MRFSIVVCNFNHGRYVDQAIRSAIDQSYGDVEVIVVDDGSTDNSRAVIEGWGTRVHAIFKPNGGQISAYNAGFEQTTGDIVMFLDADDWLQPEACAAVADAFVDPDVVKVHFRLQLVDINGQSFRGVIPRTLDRGHLGEQLRSGRLYNSPPSSGNAYRRSALEKLMPLVEDVDDLHGADFFAVYGISFLGKVESIEHPPLGRYRVESEVAASSLTFGNAVRRLHEPERTLRRFKRLRRLLIDRLGTSYTIPSDFANFSIDKLGFVAAVFDAPNYAAGVKAGASYFRRRLYRAIHAHSSPPVVHIGLVGWSLSVILLPRGVGRSVARYVCNPASR